jgi:hypothetical protein
MGAEQLDTITTKIISVEPTATFRSIALLDECFL